MIEDTLGGAFGARGWFEGGREGGLRGGNRDEEGDGEEELHGCGLELKARKCPYCSFLKFNERKLKIFNDSEE